MTIIGEQLRHRRLLFVETWGHCQGDTIDRKAQPQTHGGKAPASNKCRLFGNLLSIEHTQKYCA